MSDEMISFNWQGSIFHMTPQGIEAAYRYQRRQYLLADCREQLEVFVFEEPLEDVSEDVEMEKRAEFYEKYGMYYSEALELMETMVDRYEHRCDRNVAENDMWATVIKEVIEEYEK